MKMDLPVCRPIFLRINYLQDVELRGFVSRSSSYAKDSCVSVRKLIGANCGAGIVPQKAFRAAHKRF